MPAAPVSLTESDVLAALRAFLLAILPENVEIVRGLDNRVPEPLGPDFVVLTPTRRERLRTNIVAYEDVPDAGVRRSGDGVQITIQVDVHGPESAENAQRLATLLRDEYACAFFRALGVAVQPLYTGEPRQVPFTNGEGQVEERWTVDAALWAAIVLTTPQQFAERVQIGLVEVDAVYPPGASIPVSRPRLPQAAGTTPGGRSGSGTYAETIVGDGASASFTVRHNLGTTDVAVEVRDPRDGNARVPGVDDLAPTPDTVVVQFADPIPLGAPLRVIIRR